MNQAHKLSCALDVLRQLNPFCGGVPNGVDCRDFYADSVTNITEGVTTELRHIELERSLLDDHQ